MKQAAVVLALAQVTSGTILYPTKMVPQPPPYTGVNGYTGTYENHEGPFPLGHWQNGWGKSLCPDKCISIVEAIGSPVVNNFMRPWWKDRDASFFDDDFWEVRTKENCNFPVQFVISWELSDIMWNLTQLMRTSPGLRQGLKEAFSSRFPEAEIAWADYQDYDKYFRGSNGTICIRKNIDPTTSWDEAFTAFDKFYWVEPSNSSEIVPEKEGLRSLDLSTNRNSQHFMFAASQYGSWVSWKEMSSKWGRAFVLFTSSPPGHGDDGCNVVHENFPFLVDADMADSLWSDCTPYYYPDYQVIYYNLVRKFINVFVFSLHYTWSDRQYNGDWIWVTRFMGESERQIKEFLLDGSDIAEMVGKVLDEWKDAECDTEGYRPGQVNAKRANSEDGLSFARALGQAPPAPLPRSYAIRRPDLALNPEYREARKSKACRPPIEIVFIQEASLNQTDIINFLADEWNAESLFRTYNGTRSFKMGVTSFQDMPVAGFGTDSTYCWKEEVPLTGNSAEFAAAYRNIVPGETGDLRNSQLSAILHTLYDDGMDWSSLEDSVATKLIVLLTSTPGHHGEDGLKPKYMAPFNGESCGMSYYPDPFQAVQAIRDSRTYFSTLMIDQSNGAWEDWSWLSAVVGESKANVEIIRPDGSDLLSKLQLILQLVSSADCADMLSDEQYVAYQERMEDRAY